MGHADAVQEVCPADLPYFTWACRLAEASGLGVTSLLRGEWAACGSLYDGGPYTGGAQYFIPWGCAKRRPLILFTEART